MMGQGDIFEGGTERDLKGNLRFSSCPSVAWKKIAVKECHLLASPPMCPKAMDPCKRSPVTHLISSPIFSLQRLINLR